MDALSIGVSTDNIFTRETECTSCPGHTDLVDFFGAYFSRVKGLDVVMDPYPLLPAYRFIVRNFKFFVRKMLKIKFEGIVNL